MSTIAELHVANRSEIVARYHRFRQVTMLLNQKLVKRLSKETIHEAARKLGILKKGTVVLGAEDEVSVLMDYAIYDVCPNGRNAVEQFLIDSRIDPNSDEMTCLRAMQRARYSVLIIESVERGVGIFARDIMTDETLFIVDLAFSVSGVPGLVFASRQLSFDGFSMTCGATLPMIVLPANKWDVAIKELRPSLAIDADGHFDPATLIRACLFEGLTSKVRYLDPNTIEEESQELNLAPISRSARVGRNEPCPCGSGKKFKQCCLNRP